MREHGIEDKSRIYLSSQEPQACNQVAQEFFAGFHENDHPSAIYAASDMIAIYFVEAAYQAGVAVPEELSIVGYDTIDMSAFTIPPLTTVNQSGIEIGEWTTGLLLNMIEKELAVEEVAENFCDLSCSCVNRQANLREISNFAYYYE
jgi:DNA-binding LacI/PurR family transcriptional regulator